MSPARAGMPDAWPDEGLETLSACPICGGTEAALLHGALRDEVFFSAPGTWRMWRCGHCRSGFLNPRPNEATIGLAYRSYYTHEDENAAPLPAAAGNGFKQALANGYRNWRYGTHLAPANAIGIAAGLVLPPVRWGLDFEHRYLPRPPHGTEYRVLDVGCGDGSWLEWIGARGWRAAGAEPDPVAQQRAAARGLDVRQGDISAWTGCDEQFDAITMSHVIEHVHDPVATLRSALSLLRPGGRLFVETPNIDALGHGLYGPHWRGLEPPRHLCVFSRRGLSGAARAAGFANLRYRRRPTPIAVLGLVSARVAARLPAVGPAEAGAVGPSRWIRLRSAFARGKSEFLTLVCERPA
ncbi:MAG: class I SAM-dependent methyltransferase [Sphingomonadales bacterium]